MNFVGQVLKAAPEAALFFALALGHALGRLKLAGFSLGGVAGSLLVALVVGQLTGVVIPEALKGVCFALFIYAIGFKSGPGFFGGLNRSSIRLVVSSFVQCGVAFVTVIILARLWGIGKGFGAGLGAGALTQTAMLGTAGDALARLGLAPEDLARLNGQMAVAFAITYVFGTVGVILFVRSVAPRLLGVDPVRAARELETTMAGGSAARYIAPFVPVVARAFEVNGGSEQKVGELAKRFGRASIERIVRDGQILEPTPEVVLKSGDLVGIAGRLEAVLEAGRLVGAEVENRDALSFSAKAATVVITKRRVVGQTLAQVREDLGKANLQGVYLASFQRQGLSLPILPGTEIRRGDVVELVGRPEEVDRVVQAIGAAEASDGKSDLAYHALAIVLGVVLGSFSITIGGIPLTLGVGGGILVAGLCFGWLHVRYPVFGGLPGPAQWILCELGLSAFVAAMGLAAGPRALAAIQAHGISLMFAGAIVTLVPLMVALAFGRVVLRLHPVILLGAICGGQTVAAGLNAANEVSDSNVPTLGFTVTYAVSNVLLALGGPVIVAFT